MTRLVWRIRRMMQTPFGRMANYGYAEHTTKLLFESSMLDCVNCLCICVDRAAMQLLWWVWNQNDGIFGSNEPHTVQWNMHTQTHTQIECVSPSIECVALLCHPIRMHASWYGSYESLEHFFVFGTRYCVYYECICSCAEGKDFDVLQCLVFKRLWDNKWTRTYAAYVEWKKIESIKCQKNSDENRIGWLTVNLYIHHKKCKTDGTPNNSDDKWPYRRVKWL